jgi:hypothetical protein
MVDIRTRSNPPPPSPYRRSRGPLIALVVLAVIGVGAVVFLVANAGNEAPPAELATTPSGLPTTGPTTTLDPDAATKAEIIEAYRQSWDAFVAVASDPNGDPEDPRLEKHTVGNALLASQLTLRKWRDDGHVLEVTALDLNPAVVELGPETAVLEDCLIDVSALVDNGSGEIVEPAGPPAAELARATFRLIDGVWMQNGFKDAQGSCAPPGS